jgi:hypothetical protein
MATVADGFTICYPADFDARQEHEVACKGWLADASVQLEDGSRYALFFVDPARLQQELKDSEAGGQAYFAEPNLVVLPQVTRSHIEKAVEGLVKQDFFRNLKPMVQVA